MTFKEKINVIKRSAKLLEKANKGIFRRGMINHLPEVIGTFSGIYLASLVIDGVMGGKPVSYLLTAALIVCGIDLISYFIRHINNRHYAVNDTVYFKNVERFICEKVMNIWTMRGLRILTHAISSTTLKRMFITIIRVCRPCSIYRGVLSVVFLS